MELRDYQAEAIQNLRRSIGMGNKRPVLMAATGAGKTLMAAEIMRCAVEKGNRCLFVVDSLELVDQAIEAFQAMGLGVGVIQGHHWMTDYTHMVQVCTAQTLAARLKREREQLEGYEVGLVVHDEAHVQHSIRDEMAAMYPHAPVIGLSATPFAKGMGKFYDDLIIAIPMADLIEQGYLCPFKVFAPSEPDLKGVPTGTNGDYHAESASQKYTPSLIADIVKTWKKHGAGRPTIGFACNVAHSKELAKQFQQAGINAAHIDGYGGSDEHKAHRFETVRAYKEGEIDVLWSVGVLTKGFDAPRTACIIDAQPTKSLSRHIQKWGRGLRIAFQKTDCLILDHAGNAQRNGFPTDELPDVLNTGEKGESKTDRKKKDEPLPKPCPKCSFVKPVGQHKCSNCGFAPEKPSGITVEDGELVEYRPTYTKVQKLSWLYQINHYRESHGYKPGWAIHKFREKFGEEPPVKWPKKTEQPTLEVIGWLRHQQIKFAKGRGRANAS